MTGSAITGRCLCGKIRWSHPGPKTRNLMCHCDSCRRGISSAFSAVMGLELDKLEISGSYEDYHYTKESSRGYCANCGSRLWFKSDLWPTEVFMNVGVLDDPKAYVPDRHVVFDERIHWATPADDFPKFGGFSQNPESQS